MEIGSYEAKTNLPKLLKRVENGESFTITNRGTPIADLIPCRQSNQERTDTAIANILNAGGTVISDEAFSYLMSDGKK